MKKELGLTFQILSDASLEIAAAFGVREKGKNAALPATYVIGDDGTIVFAAVGTTPVKRTSLDAIVAALGTRGG